MSAKPKLLFLATNPYQSNGYARIANILANHLTKKYEVYYFGFSNFGDHKIDRHVDESIIHIDSVKEEGLVNGRENFGVTIIESYINKIKPDIFFIYNDIVVICRHLNVIAKMKSTPNPEFDVTKMKVVNYLDLVYDFENPVYIEHVNNHVHEIIAFSKHWKNNLMDMGISEKKISILHHGFDKETFKRVDKKLARKEFNFKDDDFIILNANRNSYRKAQDITIAAFLQFLKMANFDKRIKLLFHCDLDCVSGYNIKNVLKTECMKFKLDFDYISNNFVHSFSTNFSTKMSDERINMLYNACDVGINTCIGEGFGLCNLEHASLGKPQVVSNVGGLKDIFESCPSFTINPVAQYNIPSHTDDHNGTVYVCSSLDFANRIYDMFINYTKYDVLAERCSEHIHKNYDWDFILDNWNF
jgi:glycosyltransferase involved in cell wall biosynthesis